MSYTIQILFKKETENLLPWWWINYSLHSNKPLHFISKAPLTEDIEKWCLKHGTLSTTPLKTSSILLAPYHQIRSQLDPLLKNGGIFTPQSLLDQLPEAQVLPQLYDWLVDLEVNQDAVILNWGKQLPYLFSQVTILSQQYFLNLSFKDQP